MSAELPRQQALQNLNLRFQGLLRPGNLPTVREIGMVAFDLATNVLQLQPFERAVFVISFSLNYAIAAIPETSPEPFLRRRSDFQQTLLNTIYGLKSELQVYGSIIDTPGSAGLALVQQLFPSDKTTPRAITIDQVDQQERRVRDSASLAGPLMRGVLDRKGNDLLVDILPEAKI
ncbi:MAG TPA: hypothetical protein VF820_06670 [Patescibacteria group bacterium]